MGSLKAFLQKPIPRNVSWLHTLGSLLLVYLLFQTLTGILLALYYSPSTESAHASLQYLRNELFLGRFLHRLHSYGAGFVMVTVFLHMARSYFLAAYKSPRELLWLTGLLLGILLTVFAFTGQLLPYDQHGFWATIVGIEIASSAPVVGEHVRDALTGGYGQIGAVTLSRFYILHVCVLPLALVGLLGLHLAILQRVGSAGPVSGSPRPHRSFYPHQVLRDVLVAAGGTLVLFLVAWLVAYPETGPANPSPGDYVPRPEWFFLAHYEILKLIPGDYWIVGTFVLPNLLLLALVLLPFVDRRPQRGFRERPVAITCGAVVCLTLVGLTAWGVADVSSVPSTSETRKDPVAWGAELFEERECSRCHSIAGRGGDKGPALDFVSRRLRADYLPAWIRRPQTFRPDTEMPAFDGTEEQLNAIVAYLSTLE